MASATPSSAIAGALDVTSAGLVAFIKAVRKHWAAVVAATILAAGGSLTYARLQDRVYEARVLLQIDPRASQPLGEKVTELYDLGAGYWDTREYYETQFKIMTSDRVLSTVVRDLALTSDNDFLGLKQTPARPPTVEQATSALRGRVSVEPVKYSRLALVKVDDTSPKRAKRLADAVAQAYIDQNLQAAISAESDALVWLNGQVDHVKRDLDQSENMLHDFKEKNDLPSASINEASNMLRVEMQALDTSLLATRTRKAEIAARASELAKVVTGEPDELPASELLGSMFLQNLRNQYQLAMRERGALLAEGKGESHPLVKKATDEVSEARAAILAEVKNIRGAVERDLAIATRQEASESALFESARQRAVDLTMKEIEYHRLDRDRDQNEKLYGMLMERSKQADLARMMHVNNARIVDLATEPVSPVRPRVATIVGLGTALGLLLGMAFAWVRERADTSLKTPDDVEVNLSVPFLGLLPELDESADGKGHGGRRRRRRRAPAATAGGSPPELTVHDRPLSGIAEAARSIRTNLLFMNPDKPYRTLLVSSAGPSDGKTTVACSIAIALAQGGQRVCIVDCDLRRPRIHRIFDRRGDGGLTNLLVGEATLDDVAKPTGIDNLWSIPSGPIPPNPADILSSERFRRFLTELSNRFDRVIIDSPPIVAVTDAAILSTLVDGTVFVARAFRTNKHLASQGLRTLRDVDAPVVGVVLNAVNLNRHEYTYYYHYYYYKRDGYGPNQGDEPPPPSEKAAHAN
jgi:capsular exopolysaccharide synthesis family protein